MKITITFSEDGKLELFVYIFFISLEFLTFITR